MIAWPGGPQGPSLWWDLLLPAGNGNRYFVLPVLAFLFTCTWMAATESIPVPIRSAGMFLLAVALTSGVRLNWREPPSRDFDFAAAVRRYQAVAPGTKVLIMTPPDQFMLLTKQPGEPVVFLPDECAGPVRVAATLLGSNQMAWNGDAGRAEGTDPYAIFGLPARAQVCGVRVRFVLTSPSDRPMPLQMFWADTTRGDFSADERNSTLLVYPGPAALGGTSVAVPFVTGAIALLWSEFPAATPAQIKLAITHNATPRRASVVPPLLDASAAYQLLSTANARRRSA